MILFLGDPRVHPCPVGHYCPKGSHPLACPRLTYRDQTWGKNESDCFRCPAGFWCNKKGISNYTLSPCPVGRYCPEAQEPVWCPAGRRRITPQAANADNCEPCPAGYYCPFGASNYSGIPCSPGTFCKNNLTDGAAIEKECPGGYYCPAQTGDPLICPGMFYVLFFMVAFVFEFPKLHDFITLGNLLKCMNPSLVKTFLFSFHPKLAKNL